MSADPTTLVSVDDTRCTRCGNCAAVCPNRVFVWEADTLVIRLPGRCIECGHCVAVCPTEAFHHAKLSRDRFVDVPTISPVGSDALQGLFARRRSVRRFTGEPVSPEQVAELLEAAAAGPTATNSRNVRLVVLDSQEAIRTLAEHTARYYLKLERQMNNPLIRLFISLTVGKRTVDAYKFHLSFIADLARDCLANKRSLFHGAPLVLTAHASGLPYIAAANCNLAVMQMMLKAETLGLASCYNGYALTALVRDKRVRAVLGLPRGANPAAVIAFGAPAVTYRAAPVRRLPRVTSP